MVGRSPPRRHRTLLRGLNRLVSRLGALKSKPVPFHYKPPTSTVTGTPHLGEAVGWGGAVLLFLSPSLFLWSPPVLLLLLLPLVPLPLAHSLTLSLEFDRSESLLAPLTPTATQASEYYYLRAVNSFALNDREGATEWVGRLRDPLTPLPARYSALAYQIERDLGNWEEGDLLDIERDMRISGDRLLTGKAGPGTQVVQKRVVDKLERLIKEEEDRRAAAAALAGDSPGTHPFPLPGQSQPAPESVVMGGKGPGRVDDKRLKEVAAQWGSLPPLARAKVIQELTGDHPDKFRGLIESYHKSLDGRTKK